MRRVPGALACAAVCAVVSLPFITRVAAESARRAVLVKAAKPYDAIVSAIEQAGGSVTHRFEYVDGLAAEVPESVLPEIERLAGSGNIDRDEIIPLPATTDPRSGDPLRAEAEADEVLAPESTEGLAPESTEGLSLESDTVDPATYPLDATLNGVAALHASGNTGTGIVIAVIDTGYRPLFTHVAPLRIISPGFNFVTDPGEPPAISNLNDPHGTQVAGMAAANISFCFATTNRFIVTAQAFGVAVAGPPCTATSRLMRMIGGAPNARILPMKVFPAAGGGALVSRTIAAMEKAIELRTKFDAGDPSGINIKVVNMSLGGPTNAAARTLLDATVDKLIDHDIVPVVAAGNDGFSSVTVSSPGTSFSALTVGAASSAVHERIFRSQFSAPCNQPSVPLSQVLSCAINYRPDDNIQVAEFSSRGPTHDGRVDPDVIANGSYMFTQGSGTTSTTTNWVSGTSLAAPTVAGIAATLRQAVPTATARQIRNAIVMSADATKIPTATVNDQGAGYVNASAALALLRTGTVPDTIPTAEFTRSVPENMAAAGRPVYEDIASMAFAEVRPAQVAEVPFLVHQNTEKLYVRIHSVVPAVPRTSQNQFFGDDVLLRIQSAAVHRKDRRPTPPPPPAPQEDSFFLAEGTDRTFTFDRPEAGVWRVTGTGDWTNRNNISFAVDVWAEHESWPRHTAKADILEAELHTYKISVPAGTSTLDVRMTWSNMQGRYPVADLDVSLTSPVGTIVNGCSSNRAPEVCTVANPAAGTWTVKVLGFSVPTFGIPGGSETYTLRIAADGAVIKLPKLGK